jgi:hypothetical protein
VAGQEKKRPGWSWESITSERGNFPIRNGTIVSFDNAGTTGIFYLQIRAAGGRALSFLKYIAVSDLITYN